MKKVFLEEICRPKQWKTISMKELTSSGYPVYGANGKIGFYDNYTHETPTVMITCRGATCGEINVSEPFSYISGNAMALDNLSDEVDKDFLVYCLKKRGFSDVISGSAQPQITRTGLKKVQIPLPPLSEQRRIASQLDQADRLRRLHQAQLSAYDALARSLFLEMFGDPVKNEKGWEVKELGEVSDIQSGVTKGRNFKEKETVMAPYLRVANVQDGFLDLDEIKEVEVLLEDVRKYALEEGDILLTEGGDPDKLGRGGVWRGEIANCIHQNHVFRVRVDQKIFNPVYLSQQIGSEHGKRYFLRSAKQTTGIATINKTQLRKFPAQIPPLSLQTRFTSMIENLERQKAQVQAAAREAEGLFQGLLQGVFG